MKRLALFPLLFVVTGVSARADVASRASDSLGTRINGVLGGRCQSGLCRISGGSDSGRNRFHRLSEFDTRGAIQGVSIESEGIRNLVLGVTAADGSFIDKGVSLSSPAHLFVLSPGGIQLMPGASFQQIPQLTLSTAPQLRFGGGVFDVFNTSFGEISMLTGDPLAGALGLLADDLSDTRPLIRMEGVSLDIDESLLVDAPGGRIDVLNSTLSVSNSSGDGGSLTLTGDLVSVGEGSQLLATGTEQGGLVQVGGSWQNSDPTVRQASQTWMKPGSVVDASSTGAGDGGTVVIWSDLNNPSGGTVAQGTLLARGGDVGGNGGRIETSGPFLVAEPERLDVTALNGSAGEWLLDPFNITIGTDPAGATVIVPTGNASSQLFQSDSSESFVRVADIQSQLSQDINVSIATGPGGNEGGNITWLSNAPLDYSGSLASLTLNADGYIEINSDISVGSGGLALNATSGYVASGGNTLALGGDLSISAGDTTQENQAISSTFTGSGSLRKTGPGRLILSGNSPTWTGSTVVEQGVLRATTANSLGAASGLSNTTVLQGATLEVAGEFSLPEPISLDGSSLFSVSGNNTITGPISLKSNATIEVRQDSLVMTDTVASQTGESAPASLTLSGGGDVTFTNALALSNLSGSRGSILHNGSGIASFFSPLDVARVESTGGGSLRFNQLPASIFLDGGSTLIRDSDETASGTTIELGSVGGGGISVGGGYFLKWEGEIKGPGSFTKSGDGTLEFLPDSLIRYLGSTNVAGGVLIQNQSSSVISSPTVGGGGGSDSIGGGGSSDDRPKQPKPAPKPEKPEKPEKPTKPEEKPDKESELEDLASELGDDQAEELSVIAEASVLNEPSSSDGSDSSPGVSGGTTLAQSQGGGASVQVDLGGGGEPTAIASATAAQPPVASGTPQTVAPEQASAELQRSDELATSRAENLLGLSPSEQSPGPANVEDLQASLAFAKAKGVRNPGVLQVRFTDKDSTAADVEKPRIGSLVPQDFENLGEPADVNPFLAEEFLAQTFMERAGGQLYATVASNAGSNSGSPSLSQVVQASNGQDEDAFIDLTLIGSEAPVQARRVPLNRARFASLLKALYRQLSRQEPLAIDDPASPSRQLYALLVDPILESLQDQNLETLLIAADQGLQAVPFAALSDGNSFFGEKYAFALTPSLSLTPLEPSQAALGGQLALGASEFETLAPLPLVPQELEQLDASTGADRYLNDDFSPQVLLTGAADQRYDRVHVATHADFRPGGPSQSVLHTGTGPMSMAQLARLRSQRSETPLDLVVLSACRTLLGDPDSELGFAGLALQAGARSAVGTLWYVDDVVTSAFFVQFYRLLDQGLSKAEALQRTRQLFASGAIQLQGDMVIGADQTALLTGLTPAQRRRIAAGVQNPYFWSGIELIGSPW